MKKIPYIAVEGAIGAGKTTLSAMLAGRLGYTLMKEIVEENPFLDKFYQNIEEWAFQLEMFFLCNRYKQLGDVLLQPSTSSQPIVADYHIYKNMIFAERTLSGVQLDKYRQIYHLLTDDLPKPNLIIYIKADLDTLLHRIQKRGRSFEQNFDAGYLSQLVEDYETAISHIQAHEPDTTVITIDGNTLDFVESPQDFEQIVSQIKERL